MFIRGIGITKFDFSQKYFWEFAYEASLEALFDAKMKISQIDAIVFAGLSSIEGEYEHQAHKLSILADIFKTNVPIIETPAGCGTGGVAFWTALRLGYKNILVTGGERLVDNITKVTTHKISSISERIFDQNEGVIFPIKNALFSYEYFKKYKITMDDLALVAYKNHQNAFLNPNAYYYQRKVSLQQIKKSPVVASPFRLMDCSLSVNGGAAVILSQNRGSVKVIGSGYATDSISAFLRKNKTHFLATKLAAKTAYQQARIKPEKIDVAEIHDAFTIMEIFSYEDLGFAPIGKGVNLIRKGVTDLDGRLPVNPSGGLKARGHPISITGLAQIVEIYNQLMGRCEKRQIRRAKIGLTHNIGGVGESVTVHIFKID